MKILFAALPASGHMNPVLAIAQMARARGHTTLFAAASHFSGAVEAAGARFLPLLGEADADYREVEKHLPERASLPPGPAQMRVMLERATIDVMVSQAETLRQIIDAEAPDILVVDNFFRGTTPLFLDQANPCPPIVACGISCLTLDRPDGAPTLSGLPPARDEADRARYAAMAAEIDSLITHPLRHKTDVKLKGLGLPPLPCSFLASGVLLADAYLQPTVPAFEYDFGTLLPTIHFIGALPPPPSTAPTPDWWADLDGPRKLVLVTQGTLANFDFGELVEPTLAALAGRDDLLVVVTTGGRPLENIKGPIPANARLASFLDYEELLPRLALLVTNGGYGTVSLALRAGVPIVSAGVTEEKAEIGTRIGWSGVGIPLGSNNPGVEAIRDAVERVLVEPSFRERARAMAADFAALDTPREIFAILDRLVAAGPR